MKSSFDAGLLISPFSLPRQEKQALLFSRLKELSHHHQQHCVAYNRILTAQQCDLTLLTDLTALPFLPVSLFKILNLQSVEADHIVKTMTSSGTSGQQVSRIYLDKNTAALQQKVLIKIVSDFIGAARLPMLIIDSPAVMRDRAMFSARGAGILGFSLFGSDRAYALDEEMNLNHAVLESFLTKHAGKPLLLFGFTFMVWQHFYKALQRCEGRYDLSQATLIHGGGWKKLQAQAVSPDAFAQHLYAVCGISRVSDYYGMVEQTGCIYMQCEHGHLHASLFSDVIIRHPQDFSVCPVGQPGIIQVLSALPESYPGHSLLTEDEGILLGEDDCRCGRMGKYFRVLGRLKNAELRGCSDTYGA
ncbi:acyl-protein synthetase [Pantoea stewartii]|uniref:Acyl-protein synthetase n=1 Tax=Pantoea stewartii TaxID=66269 RepID=A0AB34VLP1_9GAMM|nr:acyl-protein synthetase [Pantoea stewartii]KTS74617.1 acyl-protein synthetase [Pantoea stewartii]KTT00906.1 acyl-protein synthetase [Pantoea stewartii]KTT08424.1 acyl-protein synthetase [Pantoea stewartii]